MTAAATERTLPAAIASRSDLSMHSSRRPSSSHSNTHVWPTAVSQQSSGQALQSTATQADVVQEHGGKQRDKRTGRRQKSRDSDQKFECTYEDCDRKYSRQEHLKRHYLNHKPKKTYFCDLCVGEGGQRFFVRQDLLTRHKVRHGTGNGITRNTGHRYNPKSCELPLDPDATTKPHPQQDQQWDDNSVVSVPVPDYTHNDEAELKSPVQFDHVMEPYQQQPHQQVPNVSRPQMNSYDSLYGADFTHAYEHQPMSLEAASGISSTMNQHYKPLVQHDGFSNIDRRNTIAVMEQALPSDVQMQGGLPFDQSLQDALVYPQSAFSMVQDGQQYSLQQFVAACDKNQDQQALHYLVPAHHDGQPFQSMSSDMPLSFLDQNTGEEILKSTSISMSMLTSPQKKPTASSTIPSSIRHTTLGHSFPVFNHESFNSAPFNSTDEFLSRLFDNNVKSESLASIVGNNTPVMQFPAFQTESTVPLVHEEYRTYEYHLSSERRLRLMKLIIGDFVDRAGLAVTHVRERILRVNEIDLGGVTIERVVGREENDHMRFTYFPHVLSQPMLEKYLGCFWKHVHPQLPILHRGTFAVATCPDLLLLTIIALGASSLDESYESETREQSSDLSFFLAWHIRFAILRDVDYEPPARLWIFQALLLLEVFEKLYTTRGLHERAHIHHASTLTLMERCSSLVGRVYAPGSTDPTRTPVGPDGTVNVAGFNTKDAAYNMWLSTEAHRRVAFAAFIIDTTHAAMFGHSPVLAAHQVRLQLPCDEAMWDAENMLEVKQIQMDLEARGCTPIGFLEAIKHTLNHQPVLTHTFGRTAIMAGLISIARHIKKTGSRTTIDKASQQRTLHLLRAFDFWNLDFDDTSAPGVDFRPVLLNLAHMTTSADLIDIQLYAGAARLMGRHVTPHDGLAASERIAAWTSTSQAQDAVFHALRFLADALLSPDRYNHNHNQSRGHQHNHKHHQSYRREEDILLPTSSIIDNMDLDNPNPSINNNNNTNNTSTHNLRTPYVARDDFILNRAWTLYIASLTIFAYAFSTEGPIPYSQYAPPNNDPVAQQRDMILYLSRARRIETPVMVAGWEGRNRCVGLFRVLAESFRGARWELLLEAAGVLEGCVEMLAPGRSGSVV